MHKGDAISSLEDIRKVIDDAERNPQQDLLSSALYCQAGSVYADLEMYDEAIAALNKAIAKDPQNKDAYFKKA